MTVTSQMNVDTSFVSESGRKHCSLPFVFYRRVRTSKRKAKCWIIPVGSACGYFIRGACHRWLWGFNSSSSHDARAHTQDLWSRAAQRKQNAMAIINSLFALSCCSFRELVPRSSTSSDFYQGWKTKRDSAYQSWIRFTQSIRQSFFSSSSKSASRFARQKFATLAAFKSTYSLRFGYRLELSWDRTRARRDANCDEAASGIYANSRTISRRSRVTILDLCLSI